jgi:hypothetical protein
VAGRAVNEERPVVDAEQDDLDAVQVVEVAQVQ